MRFEYWKSHDGKWYWHLKTSTSETLAEGGGYPTCEHCQTAIKLIRTSIHAKQVNLSAASGPPTGEDEPSHRRLQMA